MTRFLIAIFALAACSVAIGFWLSGGGVAPGWGLRLFQLGGVLLLLLPSLVTPGLLLREPVDRWHVRTTLAFMTLLTAGVAAWFGTFGTIQPGNVHPEFNSLFYPMLPFAFVLNLAFLGGGWLLRKCGVRVSKAS